MRTSSTETVKDFVALSRPRRSRRRRVLVAINVLILILVVMHALLSHVRRSHVRRGVDVRATTVAWRGRHVFAAAPLIAINLEDWSTRRTDWNVTSLAVADVVYAVTDRILIFDYELRLLDNLTVCARSVAYAKQLYVVTCDGDLVAGRVRNGTYQSVYAKGDMVYARGATLDALTYQLDWVAGIEATAVSAGPTRVLTNGTVYSTHLELFGSVAYGASFEYQRHIYVGTYPIRVYDMGLNEIAVIQRPPGHVLRLWIQDNRVMLLFHDHLCATPIVFLYDTLAPSPRPSPLPTPAPSPFF